MTIAYDLTRTTAFFLASMAVSGVAIAGDAPGFCAGVMPPPPDQFEPNNSFETATLYSPFAELPDTLNFSSDDDEDWFVFRAFDFPRFGNVYELDFRNPAIGAGTLIDPASGQGPGVFIRIFRAERTGLVEVQDPDGRPGSLSPVVQGCFIAPEVISFAFESAGDYAVQLSQCRNEALNLGEANIPDDEEFCIPDDASFGFTVGPGIGFQGGTLTGAVTDAMTGQPLPQAAVLGTNVGFTAYSAPGTGIYSSLGSVIDGGTANVIRPGYETQGISFDLAESEVTPCDVALMPEGIVMDPELSVTDFQISTGLVSGGDPLSLFTDVLNSGTGASAPSTFRFYLSDDANIDTSDTEVFTAPLLALMPSQQLSDTTMIDAPLSGGNFFAGVCIDPVQGETDTSNNCSEGRALTIDYLFADSFETPVAAVQKGAPPTCTLL